MGVCQKVTQELLFSFDLVQTVSAARHSELADSKASGWSSYLHLQCCLRSAGRELSLLAYLVFVSSRTELKSSSWELRAFVS